MTSQTPKISVLMSVYNGAKYLREAVASILNQTFTNFEFIIINDGSTDTTADILNSYSDPRIKIISNPYNLGLTKSLNIGLKIARGEYIARMDADDLSLLNRLKEQYEYMEKNPDITLLGSQIEKIDENGETIGYKASRPQDHAIVKFWLTIRNPFTHPTIFFRKKIISNLGNYNEKYLYAQDFELYSRIIKKYKITNLPEVLIKFRYHGESITRTSLKRKVQLEYALSVIHKNINEYIDLNNKDTNIFIDTINNRCTNLTYILKSLKIYKKLFKSFIKKEKINKNQFKKIQYLYKNERKMIIGNFLKTKIPYIYKIIKYFK